MSGYINLSGNNYKLTTDISSIRGMNGLDNPTLFVPLTLQVSEGFGDKSFRKFIITGIEGDLRINGSQKISHAFELEQSKVEGPTEVYLRLEFPLNDSFISKLRSNQPYDDDLQIRIDFRVQVSIIGSWSSRGGGDPIQAVVGFEIGTGDIQLTISHSQWNEKIIPGLGLNPLSYIAIPHISNLDEEVYKESYDELKAAEKYIRIGDYDKEVAHCRSAIEPIKKSIQDWKTEIESSREYNWIKKVSSKTFEWLDVIQKETSHLSSKSHHYPSLGHFSKSKAEIIYLITLSIVAYVGQIKSD